MKPENAAAVGHLKAFFQEEKICVLIERCDLSHGFVINLRGGAAVDDLRTWHTATTDESVAHSVVESRYFGGINRLAGEETVRHDVLGRTRS